MISKVEDPPPVQLTNSQPHIYPNLVELNLSTNGQLLTNHKQLVYVRHMIKLIEYTLYLDQTNCQIPIEDLDELFLKYCTTDQNSMYTSNSNFDPTNSLSIWYERVKQPAEFIWSRVLTMIRRSDEQSSSSSTTMEMDNYQLIKMLISLRIGNLLSEIEAVGVQIGWAGRLFFKIYIN